MFREIAGRGHIPALDVLRNATIGIILQAPGSLSRNREAAVERLGCADPMERLEIPIRVVGRKSTKVLMARALMTSRSFCWTTRRGA